MLLFLASQIVPFFYLFWSTNGYSLCYRVLYSHLSACLISFLLLHRSKLLGDKSRFLCQDTFKEFSGVSFNVSKCKGYNVWTRDRSGSVFLPYNPIKSDWIVTVNPVRMPDINPKKRFFYLPRLLGEFW